MRRLRLSLALVILVFSAACQSAKVAPFSSSSVATAQETDEQELWRIAARAERRIENAGLIYSNAELEAYIHGVAAKLVSNRLENADSQIKVLVFQSPYRNAWTFPDGTFYITTGLLACLDSEAELAFVLGHETTHFIRRHELQEMRSAANKKVWADVLGNTSTLIGLGPTFGILGSAWAQSAIHGYSRELETEADEQGLEEMAEAGYDPTAVLHVFTRLREEGEKDKVVDAEHPSNKERVHHCRELIAVRYADLVTTGRINREEYVVQIRQVLLDDAKFDEAADRMDFAREAIDRYVAQWPDSASGYFARGEFLHLSGGADAVGQEIAFQEAVQLDPCYPDPHRELGLLYRLQNRLKDARNEFSVYLSLAPNAVDARTMQRYVDELSVGTATPPTP